MQPAQLAIRENESLTPDLSDWLEGVISQEQEVCEKLWMARLSSSRRKDGPIYVALVANVVVGLLEKQNVG